MSFMRKNNPLKVTISLRTKIKLIIFGLFLCFLIIEVGLRLGGFLFLSLQEYRNIQSIKQKGTYRIMCLGESTTENKYPQFLEQALNQSNIGLRFSAIDKGISGTNTSAILSQVEDYLNVYNPDMVVTMMGINDYGKHIPFEIDTASKAILLIRSFRIYKLIRLLWLHILTKAQEIGIHKPNIEKQLFEENRAALKLMPAKHIPNEDLFKKAIELNPENDRAYTELARVYREQGKHSKAEDLFNKAIELNPANDQACAELGWIYKIQGKLPEAIGFVKKAIELNPENDWAYFKLAWIYREQGKLPEAIGFVKKAIELNPENDWAYTELGRVYREQGKHSKAEDSFSKAIELNPENDWAYFKLAWIYREQGKLPEAIGFVRKAIELNPENDWAYFELGWIYKIQGKHSEAIGLFKKSIELNPENDCAYTGLGWIYREQGELSEAEDLFRKALEIHPENDWVYGALAILYEDTGQPELATKYAKKANELRLQYYNCVTVDNYRKLKEILDKRVIRLVCVQYPMRNIEPLKNIFKRDEGVVFVDNESIFKQAVQEADYKEYFIDMFAGDFGHCTEKGNRLLAQNIADTILKEVFHE
jgi:tetratricopeptide (TPR) repeat protein